MSRKVAARTYQAHMAFASLAVASMWVGGFIVVAAMVLKNG